MAASANTGTVSKETMLMVAVATFVIGFLSGIVFSVYKGGPAPATMPQTGPPTAQVQAPAGGGISAQDSDAILALEKDVAVHPDNVMAWTQLGHKYFDTSQFTKAINAYNRSLKLEPNQPDVWTDLGVMFRRNRQPKEALAAFDKAAQLAPDHQACRFNRGVVYLYDLKDPQGAIDSWKEVLAINPSATAPNGKPLGDLIAEVAKQVGKK